LLFVGALVAVLLAGTANVVPSSSAWWRFWFTTPDRRKPLDFAAILPAVGKKKSKDSAGASRPGRKELEGRVAELEEQNDALRARLDRIAEIAAAPPPGGEEEDAPV
jgi:hypothetical protein